jgi:Family of unknown function (DUF6460)
MGSNLQRFLGGSPLAVLVKLAFLSLLVGTFMSFLGVTPGGLIRQVWWTLQSMFDISLDSLREVGRWIVYGAVIVVPLWFLSRLASRGR